MNSMIHELDSVPWMLDDPLVAVTVFAPTVPDGALQDAQVAVLETAGGVVVTAEVFVNAGTATTSNRGRRRRRARLG